MGCGHGLSWVQMAGRVGCESGLNGALMQRVNLAWRRLQSHLISMGSGYEPKLDLADQCGLDYGRHRSGLKYGLSYLLGLHRVGGTTLDAFLERTFTWHPNGPRPHLSPWIGMVHVPPSLPEWFHPEQSHGSMYGSELWDASREHCRGLFAFSAYHRDYLQSTLGVPVNMLFLPTVTPLVRWSWRRFEANQDRKVVQIGWWLRRLHSIFELQCPTFRKVFLDVGHASVRTILDNERSILKKQQNFDPTLYDTVTSCPFLKNSEYDQLLAKNIVFLHLYDASANNAIVECMVRNTPILVNPLPAVVEYLGKDYPFYFQTLEEAAAKLQDMDLIHKTHTYLCAHSTTKKLSGGAFLRSMASSYIYKSLEQVVR